MNLKKPNRAQICTSINLLLLFATLNLIPIHGYSQGTWIKVAAPSFDYNNGVMILLSDGSVVAKSCAGGTDTTGNLWDRLTPDTNGSYVNGTWGRIAAMNERRLYCSSQLLRDGRLYVAGGEYGSGSSDGEIYDPLTDKWTMTGPLPAGFFILDGNSQLLPDGKVLQGIVYPGKNTCIFNPAANTYTTGPVCHGSHDEAAWLKLPDNSILYVDIASKHSERYIPSLSVWVKDDSLPVALYDNFGKEAGASFLLPDGRAFFIGSTNATAYYTPSGTDSPGHWVAGPAIPDSFGAPDAAAAMMADGKILCAFSKTPHLADTFPAPTVFFEFDYVANSFTRIAAPDGGDTMAGPCYVTGMVDLPDGSVMFATLNSATYYVYVPGGAQLATGKPIVDQIIKLDCHKYMATGKLFNGISQGAAYGDDWQMPTNYPIIRLSMDNDLYGELVYYARTYDWNSTGVMRGNAEDTTSFTLPAGLPDGTYKLEVIANGIHSDTHLFTTCNTVSTAQTTGAQNNYIRVYPNPATGEAIVNFGMGGTGRYNIKLIDVLGKVVSEESGDGIAGANTYMLHFDEVNRGVYTIVLQMGNGVYNSRVVVE